MSNGSQVLPKLRDSTKFPLIKFMVRTEFHSRGGTEKNKKAWHFKVWEWLLRKFHGGLSVGLPQGPGWKAKPCNPTASYRAFWVGSVLLVIFLSTAVPSSSNIGYFSYGGNQCQIEEQARIACDGNKGKLGTNSVQGDEPKRGLSKNLALV